MKKLLKVAFYGMSIFMGLVVENNALAYESLLGVDLGGGYQTVGSSAGGNNLNGGFFNGKLSYDIRNLSFGNLSTGFGFQDTWQSGTSKISSQSISTRLPMWDVGYTHALLTDRVQVGVLIRNMFGAGAHYNVSNLNSFQWLFSVGPQIEYRIPIELAGHDGQFLANISGLYGVTGGTQTIWQFPLTVGLRFSLETNANANPAGISTESSSGSSSGAAQPEGEK